MTSQQNHSVSSFDSTIDLTSLVQIEPEFLPIEPKTEETNFFDPYDEAFETMPKKFGVSDLVNFWTKNHPQLNSHIQEAIYHNDMIYIEVCSFMTMTSGTMQEAIDEIDEIIKAYSNKFITLLVLIEQLSLLRNGILKSRSKKTLFHESKDLAVIRLDALLNMINTFLTAFQATRTLKKIKWQRSFADFVEIFNMLFDTGCFGDISKKDSFDLMKGIFDFGSNKTHENFQNTSSTNLRRGKPMSFYHSLGLDYEQIILAVKNCDDGFDKRKMSSKKLKTKTLY